MSSSSRRRTRHTLGSRHQCGRTTTTAPPTVVATAAIPQPAAAVASATIESDPSHDAYERLLPSYKQQVLDEQDTAAAAEDHSSYNQQPSVATTQRDALDHVLAERVHTPPPPLQYQRKQQPSPYSDSPRRHRLAQAPVDAPPSFGVGGSSSSEASLSPPRWRPSSPRDPSERQPLQCNSNDDDDDSQLASRLHSEWLAQHTAEQQRIQAEDAKLAEQLQSEWSKSDDTSHTNDEEWTTERLQQQLGVSEEEIEWEKERLRRLAEDAALAERLQQQLELEQAEERRQRHEADALIARRLESEWRRQQTIQTMQEPKPKQPRDAPSEALI